MPRKPSVPAVIVDPVNHEVLGADLEASALVLANQQVADQLYGDTVPYQRDRIVTEVRYLLAQSAEAMLEAGKRLVLLREHESRGDWGNLLDRIGLERTVAARMMQAAVKFSTPRLAQQFAKLGRSKIFELLVIDDDEVLELADGGTVAELDLDDIARMPTSDLRRALREARHKFTTTVETAERQLADKNKKIDELDAALSRRDAQHAQQPADVLVADIWTAALGFVTQINTLRAAYDAIYAARESVGSALPERVGDSMTQSLVHCMQQLEELRREFGLNDVDLFSVVIPPWQAQADEIIAKKQH